MGKFCFFVVSREFLPTLLFHLPHLFLFDFLGLYVYVNPSYCNFVLSFLNFNILPVSNVFRIHNIVLKKYIMQFFLHDRFPLN